MKTFLRIVIFGFIILGGLVMGLLLLPFIILLLIFQPSRRRRFYTFRFGSGNRMGGTSHSAETPDVPSSEDIIDVEAREIGRSRPMLDDAAEKTKNL